MAIFHRFPLNSFIWPIWGPKLAISNCMRRFPENWTTIIKELALVNALQENFPDLVIHLCTFHIDRNVIDHMHEYFGKECLDDPSIKMWYNNIRKFYLAPLSENELVSFILLKFLVIIFLLVETEADGNHR